MGESGEEPTQSRAALSKSPLVPMGSRALALARCFSSIHLLCEKTRDGKGACTEHLCYECWASKEVNASTECFLQVAQKTQASGGTHALVMRASMIRTRGLSSLELMRTRWAG